MSEWAQKKTLNRSFREEPIPAAWLPSPTSIRQAPPASDIRGDLWQVDPRGLARDRLVAAIAAARDVVCVSSFLFADPSIRDAMLQVRERGVRCYLLTMSEQHLLKDPARLTEFGKKQVEEHKATLDSLAGHVLVRTAEHFHAKFVVVDPKGPRPRGFVSTANFTTEALTRNVELVVQVDGETARALFNQFREGFWSESERELFEPGRLEALGQTGRRAVPPPRSEKLPITASGSQGLRMLILDLVKGTRDDLALFSYNMALQHEVTQAVLAKAKEGRRVRVFLRPRDVNMAAAVELAKAGVEVYSHQYLHAKGVLARSGGELRGLVMSANVESRGLDSGFETGVVLPKQECPALQTILDQWSASFSRLRLNIPRGEVEGTCLTWDGRELREAVVGGSHPMDLGEIEAKSIREIEGTTPRTFPGPSVSNPLLLPWEISYQWTNVPPRVPKGARRVQKGTPLPIFELKGKQYVAVPSPEQLEEGLRLGGKLGAQVVASRSEDS